MTASPATQLRLKPLPPDDPRVARVLFTYREAAAYVAVPTSTLKYWARPAAEKRPLVTAFPSERGVPSLPFVGLTEAYVLSVFKTAGVSMHKIRPALESLKADMGLDYALASGHLYTDGREVLFDYAFQAGKEVQRQLTEVRSRQTVFRPIIRQHLKRIQWDADQWPQRLRLPAFTAAEVVVDLRRAYGRPILVSGDARVEDLVGRFFGGDPIDDIAQDFGVSAEAVEDAIRVSVRARAA